MLLIIIYRKTTFKKISPSLFLAYLIRRTMIPTGTLQMLEKFVFLTALYMLEDDNIYHGERERYNRVFGIVVSLVKPI